MRILIAIGVLLLAGMVGVILKHEPATGSRGALGPAGAKIATISHGDAVEIRPHLAEGQRTVVEFTADW